MRREFALPGFAPAGSLQFGDKTVVAQGQPDLQPVADLPQLAGAKQRHGRHDDAARFRTASQHATSMGELGDLSRTRLPVETQVAGQHMGDPVDALEQLPVARDFARGGIDQTGMARPCPAPDCDPAVPPRVQRSLEAVMWNFEQEIGPKMAGRQVVAREGIERRVQLGSLITNAVVWSGGSAET